MALAIAPPPNDRKRVKVYELKENDWYDRGTGFCTGQILDVRTDGSVLDFDRARCSDDADARFFFFDA